MLQIVCKYCAINQCLQTIMLKLWLGKFILFLYDDCMLICILIHDQVAFSRGISILTAARGLLIYCLMKWDYSTRSWKIFKILSSFRPCKKKLNVTSFFLWNTPISKMIVNTKIKGIFHLLQIILFLCPPTETSKLIIQAIQLSNFKLVLFKCASINQNYIFITFGIFLFVFIDSFLE